MGPPVPVDTEPLVFISLSPGALGVLVMRHTHTQTQQVQVDAS